MNIIAMSWDVRALFAVLDLTSRIYVFFVVLSGIWGVAAWVRFSLGIRSLRAEGSSSRNQTLERFEAAKDNLHQFFVLTFLFFGACFCNQLFFGLRSMSPIYRGMDVDTSPPFDALFAVTQLSFSVLVLLQIIHWHMSAKLRGIRCAGTHP